MIRKECLVAKQKATQAAPLLRIIVGGLALVSCWPLTAFSAYQTLDQLLNEVRQEHAAEQAENRKREQRFIEARDQQQTLLSKAKGELAKEEARGRTIKQEYDANEKNIDVKLDALKKTQGALGELHGIVRQVAGDLKGTVESSLVSAQLPGRVDFLRDLSESKELPSIDELEQLWHSMLYLKPEDY
jgi:biopolymer transport protein ExbB